MAKLHAPKKVNSAYETLFSQEYTSWIGNNLRRLRKKGYYFSNSKYNKSYFYQSKAVFWIIDKLEEEGEQYSRSNEDSDSFGFIVCDSLAGICYDHLVARKIGEYIGTRIYYFMKNTCLYSYDEKSTILKPD